MRSYKRCQFPGTNTAILPRSRFLDTSAVSRKFFEKRTYATGSVETGILCASNSALISLRRHSFEMMDKIAK
jgi:hypothetical protein